MGKRVHSSQTERARESTSPPRSFREITIAIGAQGAASRVTTHPHRASKLTRATTWIMSLRSPLLSGGLINSRNKTRLPMIYLVLVIIRCELAPKCPNTLNVISARWRKIINARLDHLTVLIEIRGRLVTFFLISSYSARGGFVVCLLARIIIHRRLS